MTEEFNYSLIPVTFPYCFEKNCTKYEECLHGFMCKYLTAEPHIVTAVNPLQACPQGECPHFKAARQIRYAKGLKRALDNLPYKVARAIKGTMKVQYKRRDYYRVLNGEKYLSPAEQAELKRIFISCGVSDEIVFDSYYYDYEW